MRTQTTNGQAGGRPFVALIAAALACLGFVIGCGSEEPQIAKSSSTPPAATSAEDTSLPNVLIVVLDTTRADAVSAYGNMRAYTPNLDALAAEGTLFEQARATSCWTLPTHASLFTGLYSFQHNAHHETDLLEDDQVTLAELLGPTHNTAGFSENPHIIRAKGFAQGFDHYLETFRTRDPSLRLKTVEGFRKWYATRDRSRPFFAFVNLFTPHLPYEPPPRWQDHFFSRDEIASGVVTQMMGFKESHARLYMTGGLEVPEEAFEILRRLYLADTAYADERLGEILETLRLDHTYDDTLIVVVSDHGENIGDHGLAEHQFGLYETVLRVPTVMRYPGVFESGKRRQGPVQLIDVAPTVLEIVDADPVLWKHIVGQSLVTGDPPDDRPILSEFMRPVQQRALFARVNPGFDFRKFDRRLKSLQIENYKLIASERGELELYDLSIDPGELTNLIDENPDEARRLRNVLMDIVQDWDPRKSSGKPTLDDEAIEKLRSLGYIN